MLCVGKYRAACRRLLYAARSLLDSRELQIKECARAAADLMGLCAAFHMVYITLCWILWKVDIISSAPLLNIVLWRLHRVCVSSRISRSLVCAHVKPAYTITRQ